MHPAHQTVGVRGEGIVVGPFGWVDGLSIDRLVAAPLQVALVAYQPDADAQAAMALFEQAIDGRLDLQCGRVEMDALDAGLSRLADADCVVVFGRELQVLCPQMDLAAAARAVSGSRTDYDRHVRLEIEPAARWHPVLEGVEPFVSLHCAPEKDDMPGDATILLRGRSRGVCQPVAWLHCRYGRAFHTRLGSVADFDQADFIRVLLNAAAWVGCP
jgi:hypothetical protein